MCKYAYAGPVMGSYDRLAAENWKGETRADSRRKALSNLSHQYKTKNGLTVSAKVTLDPKYLKEA